MNSCANCLHWRKGEENGEGGNRGNCHRYPRIVIPMIRTIYPGNGDCFGVEHDFLSIFPEAWSSDLCGEWKIGKAKIRKLDSE